MLFFILAWALYLVSLKSASFYAELLVGGTVSSETWEMVTFHFVPRAWIPSLVFHLLSNLSFEENCKPACLLEAASAEVAKKA